MAKTLLAIDDSVTMRKVLEITFSGEDFRVITAENAQGALGKLGENPGVFVVDTVLGADPRDGDGYALAKELRRRSPGATIVMLASRYAPYDQGRGRDAGADDWADKPFDTQQLIDKVRKVILAKEAGGALVAAPAPAMGGGHAQAGAARAPAAPLPAPMVQGHGAASAGRPAQPAAGPQNLRSGTLVFGESPHAPPAINAPQAPPSAPSVSRSGFTSGAPGHAQAVGRSSATVGGASGAGASTQGSSGNRAIGAAVNGHLADKLGELGLTSQQAEAVLALSRDVVERVVWEVVPQLAETMIKEEIQRLMKE